MAARKPRHALLRLDAFRLALWVGAAFTALHLANAVSQARDAEVPVVGRIESAVQDWALTRLRGPRKPSGDVVIVAIDERSVRAEGKWPWSRAKMALLVDRLAAGGVRAVGFDVVWSEEDELPRRLARVNRLVAEAAAGPGGDRLRPILEAARGEDARFPADADPTELLVDAIERAGNVVVGFSFLSPGDATPGELARSVERARFLRCEGLQLRGADGKLAPAPGPPAFGPAFAGVLTPVDEVLSVADAGGFFEVFPDPDSVLRRYTVVARAGGSVFPSLGAAVLAKALSRDGVAARVVPVGSGGGTQLDAVIVGDRVLDVDGAGRVGLDYAGRYLSFPTWSAADVLAGALPAGEMRGRIALVGTTAAGTWDQRVTPFDDTAPGVITHATFVENALRGQLLRRSPVVLLAEALLMAGLAVGLAWLFSRVRSALAAPAMAAAVAGWLALAVGAYLRFHAVVALGLPVLQIVAMFVASTSWRFVAEEREKRRARETFSRFLAPAVVEEVLGREGGLRLGGEKRDLTVLFADIRGFTTISERLDPRVVIELLNEYLTPMTDIIVQDHRGTLDKYMGDAIMAFWGAPQEQPDHALRACQAALSMTGRLERLRAGWRERGLPEIDIGVGINTGPMSVGFVGSQDRFYNYTVLGDAVNLASRLEGTNREYGTRILVSHSTWERVRDQVVARELDAVRVKGKREPVVIHELLGLGRPGPEQAAFLSEFEWGLSAYKGQRWEEAMAHFRSAIALAGPDACSQMYLQRCEAMRQSPPGPGWDGVYQMLHK
ncbi:MAG TPA: adenylate/guanylate cyclase domain-containing protein [Anaeromyxobacteraceae bacterium]|nr:adenylate/guanylate cyclase domain-containing protein [Anaeromyxobacteraceae bacterium]